MAHIGNKKHTERDLIGLQLPFAKLRATVTHCGLGARLQRGWGLDRSKVRDRCGHTGLLGGLEPAEVGHRKFGRCRFLVDVCVVSLAGVLALVVGRTQFTRIAHVALFKLAAIGGAGGDDGFAGVIQPTGLLVWRTVTAVGVVALALCKQQTPRLLAEVLAVFVGGRTAFIEELPVARVRADHDRPTARIIETTAIAWPIVLYTTELKELRLGEADALGLAGARIRAPVRIRVELLGEGRAEADLNADEDVRHIHGARTVVVCHVVLSEDTIRRCADPGEDVQGRHDGAL